MKSLLVAILLTVLSFHCFAGRPVFHDISLAELTQDSQVIAVVAKATPFKKDTKGKYECDRENWQLNVKELLKGDPAINAGIGSRLDVLSNVTSLKDCIFRKGGKTTGVSFSTTRYQSSDPKVILMSDEFIVFLVVKNGLFELVADNAVETILRKSELERYIDHGMR